MAFDAADSGMGSGDGYTRYCVVSRRGGCAICRFAFGAAGLRLPPGDDRPFFERAVAGYILGLGASTIGAVSLVAAVSLLGSIRMPYVSEVVYLLSVAGQLAGFLISYRWQIPIEADEDW